MLESYIDKNGRITLPKTIQSVLGVQPGDRLRFVIADNQVRILPVRPINRLFGALQRKGDARSLDDIEEAITAGAIKN